MLLFLRLLPEVALAFALVTSSVPLRGSDSGMYREEEGATTITLTRTPIALTLSQVACFATLLLPKTSLIIARSACIIAALLTFAFTASHLCRAIQQNKHIMSHTGNTIAKGMNATVKARNAIAKHNNARVKNINAMMSRNNEIF